MDSDIELDTMEEILGDFQTFINASILFCRFPFRRLLLYPAEDSATDDPCAGGNPCRSRRLALFWWVDFTIPKCLKILAIVKDWFAAWATRQNIKCQADEPQSHEVFGKYIIFLASFLLEDLGQILCQESVEVILLLSSLLTSQHFESFCIMNNFKLKLEFSPCAMRFL